MLLHLSPACVIPEIVFERAGATAGSTSCRPPAPAARSPAGPAPARSRRSARTTGVQAQPASRAQFRGRGRDLRAGRHSAAVRWSTRLVEQAGLEVERGSAARARWPGAPVSRRRRASRKAKRSQAVANAMTFVRPPARCAASIGQTPSPVA